jgi:hypothetical protein
MSRRQENRKPPNSQTFRSPTLTEDILQGEHRGPLPRRDTVRDQGILWPRTTNPFTHKSGPRGDPNCAELTMAGFWIAEKTPHAHMQRQRTG